MAETTERTEYRVVGENDAGERWERDCGWSKQEARQEAFRVRKGSWNRWVKIQESTVTETRTPWVDLDEEGS